MSVNLRTQLKITNSATMTPGMSAPTRRPLRETQDTPATPSRLNSNAVGSAQGGSAKITLALKVNKLLDKHQLNQRAAALLLGMPQPKVSAIRNYKLRGISLERLMQALLALNQQVEIVVKPTRKSSRGSITVAI